MLANIHALLKDALIYLSGDFLIKCIGLLLIPIYARILTVAEFGVIETLVTIITLLGICINLGIDSAAERYFYEDKTEAEKKYTIASGFLIILLSGMFALSICLLFFPILHWIFFGNENYKNLLIISLIAGTIAIWNNYLKNILRIHFQSKLFSLINFIQNLSNILLIILFILYFQLGVISVFLGMLISFSLSLIFLIWYLRSDLIWYFNKKLISKLIRYGIAFVPATFAYWIFDLSDRLILSRFSGLGATGIYSMSLKIVIIFLAISTPFALAWTPRILHLYESHKNHSFELINLLCRYTITALTAVALCITLFAREFFFIFATPAYFEAKNIVWLLMLGSLTNSINHITVLGITIHKQSQYIFYYTTIAALINITLNIIFIPQYHFYAAAATTAISFVILTSLYLYKSEKLIPQFQIGKKHLLFNIFLFLIISIVSTFSIQSQSFIWDIVLKIILFLFYLFLLSKSKLIDFVHIYSSLKKIPLMDRKNTIISSLSKM